MLVVEDTESREILRFMLVDASVHLGEIQVGKQVKRFDPSRLFSYFRLVERHLRDLAGKYSDAYRYLPRKAYDYLKPPPILGKLYQAFEGNYLDWFVDFFLVQPLMCIGQVELPNRQQRNNIRLTQGWSLHSIYAPRFYATHDLRGTGADVVGWCGILDVKNLKHLFKSPVRNAIIEYIKRKVPLLIEVHDDSDWENLLDWFVFIKKLKLDLTPVILSLRSFKDWNPMIEKFLEIKNTFLLTAGATLPRLATVIRMLRKKIGANWSRKLIFGSSYPETNLGDSIAEWLSFLLSKEADLKPIDLHRILGGNILGLLPPRPAFLRYEDTKAIILAQNYFGRTCNKEVTRFIQALLKRKKASLVSVDFMVTPNGAVTTENMVLTFIETSTRPARTLLLRNERDGTLIASGWRKPFDDVLTTRRSDVFATLLRSAATTESCTLTTPAHLSQFNDFLVQTLGFKDSKEIQAALHYTVRCIAGKSGTIYLNPADMKRMDVDEGAIVLILHTENQQWWGAHVVPSDSGKEHEVQIGKADAEIFGLRDGESTDIVKYESDVQILKEIVFSSHTKKERFTGEDREFLHIHSADISHQLHDVLIGKGTRIQAVPKSQEIVLTLYNSLPPLMQGQVASVSDAKIRIVPQTVLRTMNVIICISLDASMEISDVKIRTLYSFIQRLEPLHSTVPPLREFLSKLERKAKRAQAAALLGLTTINELSVNRSIGRLGLITVTNRCNKFSIQKGRKIQSFVEFCDDMKSETILGGLVYSILDAFEESATETKSTVALRAIAEILEELDDEIPTLILFFGNTIQDSEDPTPFLQAIGSHKRYSFNFVALGNGQEREVFKEFERVNGTLIRMDSISLREFEDFLYAAIEGL